MRHNSTYFLYITENRENDKALFRHFKYFKTPSRQKNHSYCRVTRRAVAAAGVGYSWTQQLFLPCFFVFLLQTSATRTPDAPASRQLNAVNSFLFLLHVSVLLLRYLNMKLTWNQAVLTEDPFLLWSEVIIRDCSCQDSFVCLFSLGYRRTWQFFPCSIAA